MAKKKTSKTPLPKLAENQDNIIHLDSKESSVKGLAGAIAIAMIPVIRSSNKTLVDAMSLMQSYLLSELPDLGLVGGYLEDYAKDLFGKKDEKKQVNVADEQAKDIRIIKKENIEHTTIFDMLYNELEDILLSVRDLTSVTSDVWGVNKDQLAYIKTSNSILREQEKSSKFRLQKQQAGDVFSLKNLKLSDTGTEKKHPFLKLIESLALTRLIPILEGIVVALVETFLGFSFIKSILSKVAPKAFDKLKDMAPGAFKKSKDIFSNTFKIKKSPTASLTKSAFNVAAEGVTVSGASKFSKIGGAGKMLLKGAGLLGIAAGGIGALQGVYNGYDEGKRGLDLVQATFKGFIDGFLEPFKEMLGLDFLDYDTITDTIGQGVLTIYTKVNDMWNSITTTFTDTIDEISNMFTLLKESFLNSIRTVLQKVIPEDNRINVLGYEMDFGPKELHDFAYPKSQVEPSSRQDQKTIDMMANQAKIENAQTKYGVSGGSNINSVVNNIAPVNNTIMASPIITRNPEPLMFGGYLNL